MDNQESNEGQVHKPKPVISRYTRDTGIAVEYGEKTWRPVQSVVDIVQNHLDAQTTVYEKKLLGSLGIREYKPADKQQQKIISLLNVIKYAPQDDQTVLQAQSDLQNIVGDNSELQGLKGKLETMDYQIPGMRLKISDGNTSRFVEYSQVKDLPSEWKVIGFRVDDHGSGFDNQLLGIMGGSTKGESAGKRGGLGEGLKMSITHLVRSGASVRLLSRNADELWTAHPKVEEGSVHFHGVTRKEDGGHSTGSTTDVDFSNPDFDPKLRDELVNALDSRKGEGLGKYILDFRGDQFTPIVHNGSTELHKYNVPGGRIYVRGLLVQETENLLWSYNLGDKWAIAGRDRKTVQQDMLEANVRTAIASLDEPERIKSIIGLVTKKNNYLETKVLTEELPLDEGKRSNWATVVTEMFHFSPGETLFASDALSTDQERFATERGFSIIRVPAENAQAISLFEKLYPDQIVSFNQLNPEGISTDTSQTDISRDATQFEPLPVQETQKAEVPEIPLDAEAERIVNGCKDAFTQIVLHHTIKQTLKGKLPDIDIKRLGVYGF